MGKNPVVDISWDFFFNQAWWAPLCVFVKSQGPHLSSQSELWEQQPTCQNFEKARPGAIGLDIVDLATR
jgi:hypothetical protein